MSAAQQFIRPALEIADTGAATHEVVAKRRARRQGLVVLAGSSLVSLAALYGLLRLLI